MSQGFAKPRGLTEKDHRNVKVEGESGEERLQTEDRHLQLLESIDAKLEKLLYLIEANL